MIRVTLVIDLSEIWGADDRFAEAGGDGVQELCLEDIGALIDEARWDIVQILPEGEKAK